jgi:hypothetical protein
MLPPIMARPWVPLRAKAPTRVGEYAFSVARYRKMESLPTGKDGELKPTPREVVEVTMTTPEHAFLGRYQAGYSRLPSPSAFIYNSSWGGPAARAEAQTVACWWLMQSLARTGCVRVWTALADADRHGWDREGAPYAEDLRLVLPPPMRGLVRRYAEYHDGVQCVSFAYGGHYFVAASYLDYRATSSGMHAWGPIGPRALYSPELGLCHLCRDESTLQTLMAQTCGGPLAEAQDLLDLGGLQL